MKILKTFGHSLVLLFLAPQTVSAQQLVPDSCDGINDAGMCGFCEILDLADNIVTFLIVLATLVAVLMIVYAGFLYITAAGNTGQISRAHSVFRVTIIGFILILLAWVIIDLVVTAFLNTDDLYTALWTSWDSLPGC